MAKKDEQPRIPNWSIHVKKGIPYFRIQTYDADGRRFDIYGRSEQEVKQRMLKSNVFVSASVIENQSTSLGEAMILGLPSVASCVGVGVSLALGGRVASICARLASSSSSSASRSPASTGAPPPRSR